MGAGDELIEDAIEMVSKSQNEILFDKLMEYLEGDEEHDPKDPKYAFKLYLTFGKIEPAVRMALFIVQKEQEDGNYTEAHGILFNLLLEMTDKKVKVSYELLQKMIIIHSYTIVNKLIKLDEHECAARMLNRVCANVSQFPRHAGTILTIAVKECVQTGLKASAYTWAAQLCRPEYKNQIKEQHRRRIENTARRPVREEPDEECTPCPFCSTPVPGSDLNCSNCLNNLPFCIATGRHMTLDKVARCPKCHSPAVEDVLRRMLEIDAKCPMCFQSLAPNEIDTDIPNAKEFLREKIIDSTVKADEDMKEK
jgi:WD repeat-containing protein 19